LVSTGCTCHEKFTKTRLSKIKNALLPRWYAVLADFRLNNHSAEIDTETFHKEKERRC